MDQLPQHLDLFVTKSITDHVSSIDDVLPALKPLRFDEYEIYEKVSKLINRLNSHHISFDSQEVEKFKHFIAFDGHKYVYNRIGFDENELAQILGYKDLKYVFGKIKSEIIQIAKDIDSFDRLTQDDIKLVIGECPFSDEYYQFNFNMFNRYYLSLFSDYISAFVDRKEVILDDANYKAICDLAIQHGLLQFIVINMLGKNDTSNSLFFEIENMISEKDLCDIIEKLPDLMSFIDSEEFTIENLSKIFDLKELLRYGDLKQISLLGKDVIKKVYMNDTFTFVSPSKRISVACDLASAMISRNQSTVPYINGTCGNYQYSMYDSTDETILTAGLDTNACFRCCGNDNDFLHYCALDKNGFVIKLTDSEGNFIGRASGFRNGNGVYINQLRTIYDKQSSAYSSERASIISTFEKACNDIVEISQNNPNEENKIDFVVVTKSYALENLRSNVGVYIGSDPMENKSEDWKKFVSNTKNLNESRRGYFCTDFGNYPLICMKSAVGELTSDKIKKGDVPALYTRTRKPICIDSYSETIEQYVNKVRAYYSYQHNSEFTYLKIPHDYKVLSGDNWYIVFGDQGILDSCYLDCDKIAEMEFQSFSEQILKDSQTLEATISDSRLTK